MKYKVGERYKIKNCSRWVNGNIIVITEITGDFVHYKTIKGHDERFRSFEIGSIFDRKCLERVHNDCIVIYSNGNEVVAINKTTKEKAVAKCNPSDEFDFKVGAKIAFDRLIGSEELKFADKIKVGDMVEVVRLGKTYLTYNYWSGLCEYKSHYVKERRPVDGGKYKVLNIGKHDRGDKTLLLIQDMDTTQVFIIGIEGVKKCS
ncbi:MAG: hypothetical protein MJZ52_07025 [Bacteroidales bacterium]|nr:hypothetical protein [Bacteroidales bacterium]